MKKVITMFVTVMMCLSLSAHAPALKEQDSCTIQQRYEYQEFTNRQRYVEAKLKNSSSKYVYNRIVASPFVSDFNVNKKLFEVAYAYA